MRITRQHAGLVVFALLAACGGGGGGSDSGPLSPARDLPGTWKTTFPATVYFATEWCEPTLSLVASQDWDVTWVITPGANDNTVNIQMTFATSNFQVLAGCPDTGVVPEVSPMFLTGNVSGTRLTLKHGTEVLGDFDFTSYNIQGDFDYTWCAFDCQREYTTNRSLILNLQ